MKLPARWQPAQASQYKRLTPIRMLGIIEHELWEAAQQRGNGDLAFDAGELGAEAKMDSATERQRADIAAGNVGAVGVGIDRGIAIGGAEQAQNRIAFSHIDAPNCDSRQCRASRELHRRIEA